MIVLKMAIFCKLVGLVALLWQADAKADPSALSGGNGGPERGGDDYPGLVGRLPREQEAEQAAGGSLDEEVIVFLCRSLCQ